MKTIEFSQVKLGDYVYQSGYYAPNKWREVTAIKASKESISLGLGESAHDTIDTRTYIVGYPQEGIATKSGGTP